MAPHHALPPLPSWAEKLVDKRGVLAWDRSQTVALLGLGDVATLGIIDTGSCKTIISASMCEALGVKYEPAVGGNCGTYAVPGTG